MVIHKKDENVKFLYLTLFRQHQHQQCNATHHHWNFCSRRLDRSNRPRRLHVLTSNVEKGTRRLASQTHTRVTYEGSHQPNQTDRGPQLSPSLDQTGQFALSPTWC